MREYTHVAGALLLYTTISFLINLNITLIGLFLAGCISLFPDIIDRIMGKHRGIGHSIFWIIPLISMGFLNYGLALALIIGFMSHILFDIFTTHGVPIFYPLSKTSFVSLRMQNRIKTSTNKDKAVFIFISILLVPLLLFNTGYLSILHHEGLNLPLGTGEASGVPNSAYNTNTPIKSSVNLNLQLNANTTKNITVHQVNENDTNIVVKDLKPGG